MGFWDSAKKLLANAQAKMTGGIAVKCSHCGAQNTAQGYGTPSIPGVVVTEAVEVNCRSCGRMFIVMVKK